MDKIKLLLITSLMCVLAKIGFAQVSHDFHNSETYVETVLDSATLQILSQEFSIDRVQRNADGMFNTRIWLSFKDYDNFLARNIPYSIEQPTRATVTMAQNYAQMTANWNRYPTYSTYLAIMDTFQTRYPNLCKIDTILATTPGGRKILCAHISNNLNDNMGKPSVLYTSTIHGDEVVGYYFMLRLIDMLLTNYNTNTKITNLVNNVDIWICPLHNPDGTYHTSNNQINSSPISTRANYNSEDLNRSFPVVQTTIGSNYQPEVAAMMAFMEAHNFTLAANFHGGAEVFNYPWDAWKSYSRSHADANWWVYVGRNYADTCHLYSSSYMTDENNGITEGGDWYVITGSMQDYHNWFLGTRHVTIEVGEKVISSDSLPYYWNFSYRSLLNFMEEANHGIHGTVTDSLTGEPLRAMVYVENHDADHSYVETTLPYGDYHRPIKGGQYTVTYSAEGYNSKTITVSVADNSTLIKNVQLVNMDTASCKMPKYVTVNYDGGNSAVVSWSSTAQSCNLMLNNTLIPNVTSPYTLNNLASSTHYDVQVQANCGNNEFSVWTDTVSFTTDCLAQDRCELTFELTDSWGDSWNGASIQVVDASTGEILGELTNENLNGSSSSGENEVNTKTLALCNGKTVHFVWVSGRYDNECSYVIYDVYGDVILSGSGALATTSYTMDCGLSACAKPYGLTVTGTTASTATLSWAENATTTAWQICLNGDETNLIDVTTNPYTLTGLTAETPYTAKIRANCDIEQSPWSNAVSFLPSDKELIGSGTATNDYLPLHNYYKYSLTQQIYTTEELGTAGDIMSIDFYKNNTVTCNRNLDIYMVSTTKENFSGTTDWIPVTDADKVFSGTVNFIDNDWTSITFNTPFAYDGTHNVALIVDDNTGSYIENTSFLAFPASNQAIRVYNDYTNYNPVSPPSYSGSIQSTKNQIRVLIDRPDPCPAPTNVTVSNVDRHSAVLTWTENGDATSWVVSYYPNIPLANPLTMEVSDSAYTITGLDEGSSYVVKVRPVCEGITDSWCNPVTFMTESCQIIPLNADEPTWLEDFDNYTQSTTTTTGVEPECWEMVHADVTMPDSKRPQLVYKSEYAHSGSYSLMLNYRCVYAMPAIPSDIAMNTLQLNMYLRQAKANYRLEVGVWEDDGTFTPVQTINNSGTGVVPVAVDFSGYTGSGHRIAFHNVVGSGSAAYSYNYLDDITLSVGADAPCPPISTLDVPETFDTYTNSTTTTTGVEPNCWEMVRTDVTMPDEKRPQLVYKSEYAHSGSYSLMLNYRCVYAMPAVSADIPLNTLQLDMYLRQAKANYQLVVGVWENNGTFTPMQTINNSTTGVEHVTVDFSTYTGTGRRIAFRNVLGSGSTSYSYNYLDDVTLTRIPAKNPGATENGGDALTNDGTVSDGMETDAPTDVENFTETLDFILYPNPTTGILNVQGSMFNAQSDGKLHLFDVYGNLLQIVPITSETTTINVSDLVGGIYFVRVMTEAGVVTKTFVKK